MKKSVLLIAVVAAVATLVSGCTNTPREFDRQQGPDDKLPAYVEAVPELDLESTRLAGERDGVQYFIGMDARSYAICLAIVNPAHPDGWGSSCADGGMVGIEGGVGSARFYRTGMANLEVPDGWVPLTREVIVKK
jgi:hypothetical protein